MKYTPGLVYFDTRTATSNGEPCPWCCSPRCRSATCREWARLRAEREREDFEREMRRLAAEMRRAVEEKRRATLAPQQVRRARRPAPSVPARRQPVPISPGGWR